MKLELKHLAPYLPYGLKAVIRLREDSSLPIDDECTVNVTCFEAAYLDSEYEEFKPILRPLSDLKTIEKEIKLVDSYWYVDDYLTEKCTVDKIYPLHVIEFIPYAIMQVLLKYHFDVFGLIEKGLAIDINTIE